MRVQRGADVPREGDLALEAARLHEALGLSTLRCPRSLAGHQEVNRPSEIAEGREDVEDLPESLEAEVVP
jgi:hypothetical protein